MTLAKSFGLMKLLHLHKDSNNYSDGNGNAG